MEVTFACKKFPIDQVLRCSFGLSQSQFRLLKLLLSRGELSVEEAANLLGKDRTTVQRSMKSLVQRGLVQRRQYNLENGGYQYHYLPQNKQDIKQRIKEHFEHFSQMVHKELERW